MAARKMKRNGYSFIVLSEFLEVLGNPNNGEENGSILKY